MATNRSQKKNFKFSSPKSNSSKLFHPEPSEEPDSRISHFTKKSDHHFLMPSDRYDLSTQNSICYKSSFSINSPRSCFPEIDLTGHSRGKSIISSNNVREKTKEIGESSVLRNSEYFKLDVEEDGNIKYKDETQQAISFEGPDDLRIPRLKWCAHCGGEVMTKVMYVNNEKTFWSAVGIFLSGGVLGCFMLPYMTNSCKGAKLQCHKCERILS